MEAAEKREIAIRVNDKFEEKNKKHLELLETKVANLLKTTNNSCSFREDSCKDECLGKDFRVWVEMGKRPSEFFLLNIDRLKGFIADRYLPYFYKALDSLTEWQIDRSYYRRSYRSINDYRVYYDRVQAVIKEFRELTNYDLSIHDLLSGNYSEELSCYFSYWSYSKPELTYYLATSLDENDEKLEGLLTDILYGSKSDIKREYIRAILMSHNKKMYEVLGKTLLAARLSEGLRQSIVEEADCGTVEGFMYILGLMEENDLIRYSSVQRAICTYLGLISADEKAIDRVTKKELALMITALNDEKERENMLSSEDAVIIYIGLWSIGVGDILKAFTRAKELAVNGSAHQKKVACYFLANANIPYITEECAKEIVERNIDDMEILAVIMDSFMPNVSDVMEELLFPDSNKYYLEGKYRKHVYADYTYYFKDEDETRKFLNILYRVLDKLPKKEMEFKPSIFPWNAEKLTRSDICTRIAYIASALKDDKEIIKAAGMLRDISSSWGGDRSTVLELLLREPKEKELMEILAKEVADPETYTRGHAYILLKQEVEEERTDEKVASPKGSLPNYVYPILEDHLRLKNSEIRNKTIELLSLMGDSDKLELLSRLLKDDKEEKITAGLDIILNLKKDENPLFYLAKDYVKFISAPSTKVKILIDEIEEKNKQEREAVADFYDKTAEYEPVLDEEHIKESVDKYLDFFTATKIGEVCYEALGLDTKDIKKRIKKEEKEVIKLKDECLSFIKELDALIEENKNLEYDGYNGPILLANRLQEEYKNGKYTKKLPFLDIWDRFYDEKKPEDVLIFRALYSFEIINRINDDCLRKFFEPLHEKIFGFIIKKEELLKLRYKMQIKTLLDYYIKKTDIMKNMPDYSVAIAFYLHNCKEELRYSVTADKIKDQWALKDKDPKSVYSYSFFGLNTISIILNPLNMDERNFPLKYLVENAEIKAFNSECQVLTTASKVTIAGGLHVLEYISACVNGYISKNFMYKMLLDKKNISDTLHDLSVAVSIINDIDAKVQTRKSSGSWLFNRNLGIVERFLAIKLEKSDHEKIQLIGENADRTVISEKKEFINILNDTQKKKIELAFEAYEKIVSLALSVELCRGDSETEFSKAVMSFNRIYGIKYFVQILAALGKDNLERSSYYSYYSHDYSKTNCLSHLLAVLVPDRKDGDTLKQAEMLKELLKGTDITKNRLIEAAIYSPEWLSIVENCLGWEGFTAGCYYFMAHMKESFDDKKTAMIAKYTPLTIDELNQGAFDIEWFNDVYKRLGEKRFDAIYKAAKYISDGAKHTRARKYADAARGILKIEETEKEIELKRNKDLLMAYALIPYDLDKKDEILSKEEKVFLKNKYVFIQKYIKESKQFGAQRRASEKAAGDMAVKNMARSCGYDETRFTLLMEKMISSGLSDFLKEHAVGEYTVWLDIDDKGKVSLNVKKGDKALKSLPAAIKKDEYILDINAAKKTFTEQYQRTKVMMEEAMEAETAFLVSEILDLSDDPVIGSIINRILFKHEDKFAFANELKDLGLTGDDVILVAHPYHLYKAGKWHEFQKICFERQIVQPFKQIFRELYTKTDDEIKEGVSRRYAGNQINPKVTLGLLRARHWVADVEDGLQKIYYKENIIASIYALADWFSPSDIEEPTLEYVVFYDRKTFKKMDINDVPDIIFSEVMRDVDLVVSKAHAGEIDPEMSHSTIEMRRAIIEFVLPMFNIKNVELTESHALIKGERAAYNIHLGSGVIHQEGGPMINVLPVHSQRRGRIFLPFVDDDPKTAEIITKILTFAEDKKIKDPSILSQII